MDAGDVVLKWLEGDHMMADTFTKALKKEDFFRINRGVISSFLPEDDPFTNMFSDHSVKHVQGQLACSIASSAQYCSVWSTAF